MKSITRILRMGEGVFKAWQIRLVAVLGLLALMWACYPVTDATYSNPQNSGTGQWLIEFRTGEEKVHIELRYERKTEKGNHSSSHGFSIDPGRFSGLTREQAMSGGAHVQFQLKRDAGTFNFEGWFKDGNGSGHFTFAPDRSFAELPILFGPLVGALWGGFVEVDDGGGAAADKNKPKAAA